MVGQCELCLRDEVQLQRSHYLPAALYRLIRDACRANPNPVMVPFGGQPYRSPRQVSAYLLCANCEQRLTKNGEQWVLQHCWRKDEFLLKSVLDTAPPVSCQGGIKIFHASDFSEISIDKITYFAVSILWRSTLDWQFTFQGLTSCKEPLRLGPYQETIRRYLMGETGFPENCVLWVTMPEKTCDLFRSFSAPYLIRLPDCRAFRFDIPGVLFNLFIGKQIDPRTASRCFVRGCGNPIMVTPYFRHFQEADIAKIRFGGIPV